MFHKKILMAKEEWIIIKEFEKPIDGYPHKIKARILQLKSRNSKKMYYGKVSHHCKPSKQANGVMIPNANSDSIVSVQRQLNIYIDTFSSIGVEVNENFNQLKY